MSLISRFRARISEAAGAGESSSLIEAERLMRRGESAAEIRRLAALAAAATAVELAWQRLMTGDLERALETSYSAAQAAPYDVDSRIAHGTVRLARGDLDHAEHEFDAVIEEFGAESDAADGRRATILARGFAPVDELPASDQEWRTAAVLLTTLWRLANVVELRIAGLEHADPDCRALIASALKAGQAKDLEAGRGAL